MCAEGGKSGSMNAVGVAWSASLGRPGTRRRVLLTYVPIIRQGLMSQSIPTGYIPPGQPPGISSKTLPGGRDLTFKSCRGPEIRQGRGFCGNSK